MENDVLMDTMFGILFGATVGLAIGFFASRCNNSWYTERLAYFEKREKELLKELELANAADIVFDNQGGYKIVPRENEHCAKS